MTIGIIGAGELGTHLARAFATSGIHATISNSRGPDSLSHLAQALGPGIAAGSTQEAAAADIVIVAVRWADTARVLRDLPDWGGRVVIDATNPVEFLEPGSPATRDPSNPLAAYGIRAIDLGGKRSSHVFSSLVPGARVVKAFNHLEASALSAPPAGGGKRVLFYSGDDAAAKAEVRAVIERMGALPIDLGGLDMGGALAELPFGALAATAFTA